MDNKIFIWFWTVPLAYIFGRLIFGPIKRIYKRKAIPNDLRERIKRKYNYRCDRCGLTKCHEIHHRDGDPSNNSYYNLVLLCSECHRKIPKKRKKN